MSTTTLSLLILSALSALPTSATGTHLSYEGRFEALQGDPAASRKSFRLNAFVQPAADGGQTVDWVLREDGFGGWPWTGRYGRYAWNGQGQVTGLQPSLLYERESGKSTISIPPLKLVTSESLAAGTRWTAGKSEYEVSEGGSRQGHDTWRVRVSNAYGHQRTLWIDKDSHLVVALSASVTIGQGERHELQMELAEASPLDKQQMARDRRVLDKLITLRDSLKVDPQANTVDWKPEQLAMLRDSLRDLAEAEADVAVTSLVSAALEDANEQKGRTNAVAVLRDDVLNKPLTDLSLTQERGQPFDQKSLRDQVTVLHFWEYRDKPLEEPYGQVGYLDFLYRQRKDAGVAVYGIAVNPKLADPDERFGAVRTAKRLQQFMNLSYPLLFDPGSGVAKLGDPRKTGAKLPLVVVIDRQGRVVHYHVGFYDVDPRKGMVELDEAIQKALDG